MPATPLKSYIVEIVDTNGVLVPSPTITVRDVGTTTPATIYSDEGALKGTATNPQTVNPFRFFAEAGTVDLLVVKDTYQYRPRNITPFIHGQHILVIELENVTPGSFNVGGNLTVTGVGPHAIGGAASANSQLLLLGTFTPTGIGHALRIDTTIAAPANQDIYAVEVNPTINKAGSGTHANFFGTNFEAFNIGAGAAALTNAATVRIAGAPIGAMNNYAIWVASGDIRWGAALVALGGGAAPTFGTIGGSGPATAAQNSWMRVIDSTGVAFWVPAWK